MKGKLLLLGIVGLVAACASPGSGALSPSPKPDYRVEPGRPAHGTTPPWAGRELSWEKLEVLNAWLEHEGRRADDFWFVEAHLQLAEGRAHFARVPGVEPELRDPRKDSALSGFYLVLAHDKATASQRQRANYGLNSLDTPRGAPGSTVIPGVLARSTWGARSVNRSRLDPASPPWRWITVHHSAEPGAKPLNGGTLNDSARALRHIQSAHMNGTDRMGDIGYHFLIDPSGRIFQGRDLRYQGAHAHGANNVGNVGICLLGNFDEQKPTDASVAAMHRLIEDLHSSLHISLKKVRGHDHWRQTNCPGLKLKPELERYK
jgi:hypothetical protein